MNRAGIWLVALVLGGCDPDADTVWRQFNRADDTVSIEVMPGEPSGVASVDLRSNLDVLTIGTVTVTPAIGPVGTTHRLVIEVDEEFGERLGRASVESDGERGVESYDLEQDTARPGIFALDLTSLGAEDESRTDVWRIELWEPIEAPDIPTESEQ
jgi:hypothetical protein